MVSINAVDPDWTGPRDGEGYPIRSVLIHGAVGRFLADAKHGHTVANPLERAVVNGEEVVTVQDAESLARAMGDDESVHICPLCNDGFISYLALRIHAPDCAELRAPRRHIFLGPGIAGAKTDYRQPVKPTD